MKILLSKYLWYIILLILFSTPILQAQSNTFKLSFINIKKKSLVFEQQTKENQSLSAGIVIYYYEYSKGIVFVNESLVFTNKGMRLFMEYRFYSIENNPLEGMYFAGNFSAGQHRLRHNEVIEEKLAFASSIGAKVGWQKNINSLFIDIALNVSKNSIAKKDSDPMVKKNGFDVRYRKDMNGVIPELFVGIGFSF